MMLVVGLIRAFRAGKLFPIKLCEPNPSSRFFLRIQFIHDFSKPHMGVRHGAPSSTQHDTPFLQITGTVRIGIQI